MVKPTKRILQNLVNLGTCAEQKQNIFQKKIVGTFNEIAGELIPIRRKKNPTSIERYEIFHLLLKNRSSSTTASNAWNKINQSTRKKLRNEKH